MFKPNTNDVENYLNAEYWRLKYFRTKGNLGEVIILETFVILCLLVIICSQ